MPHIVLVALELRPELVPGRRPQPDAAVVAAGRQPLCGGTGQVTAVSSGALVAGAGSEGQAPEAGAGRAEGRRGGKGRGEGKEEACACVCVLEGGGASPARPEPRRCRRRGRGGRCRPSQWSRSASTCQRPARQPQRPRASGRRGRQHARADGAGRAEVTRDGRSCRRSRRPA